MRYALTFLVLAFAIPVHAETITGRASVIDEDTLEIQGTRIRLYGTDAPESGQVCTGKFPRSPLRTRSTGMSCTAIEGTKTGMGVSWLSAGPKAET